MQREIYLMCSHMTGVPSLRDNSGVGPYGTVRILLMHTVRLIVVLALLALQAGVQLGAEAYALPRLDQRHLGTDTQSLANDLVANRQREVLVSPTAADGVHVGTADAAGLDLDLDVEIFEGLGDDLEEKSIRRPLLLLLLVLQFN